MPEKHKPSLPDSTYEKVDGLWVVIPTLTESSAAQTSLDETRKQEVRRKRVMDDHKYQPREGKWWSGNNGH
jgi:hypothetical protein